MPKLVAEKGPDRGRSWSIKDQGVLLVGRDPDAQIHLRDDESSRRHCQIEFRDSLWWIRDLESTNGIQVNGELVSEIVALKHNDHIDIGVTRLTFLHEDDPLIGKVIGGCKVEKRIGRGGMGTVYQARQISLDRPVALKILSHKYTSDQAFIDMFIREARAAGKLSHPHIVQVYDVGKQEDLHYFTVELVSEGSIEKRIDESGALPMLEALDIVRQAAKGLEFAEKQGIVHRDIKPGNLLVNNHGIIKIGDLGIARKTDASGLVSQKEGVSGSPHYIAPEQARGDAIDQRADIYSLGATLFHCLAGKTPYKGKGARDVILKHMDATHAPDIDEVAPENTIPNEVKDLLAKMMSPSPEGRPGNAKYLGEVIDVLIHENQQKAPTARSKSGIFLVILFVFVSGYSSTKFFNETPMKSPIEIQVEKVLLDLPEAQQKTELLINSGRLGAAEEQLLQLSTEVEFLVDNSELLSSEQLLVAKEKLRNLESNLESEYSKLAELDQENSARSLLAEALSNEENPSSFSARISTLENLISKYPNTRAANKASELISELKSEEAIADKKQQAAERDWNLVRSRAEGWLRSDQPGRARAEVLQLSEVHRGTRAWDQRDQFLMELTTSAISMWQSAMIEARSFIEEGRLAEAEDILNQMSTRALIPETESFSLQLRGEIENSNSASKTPEKTSISPALTRSWGIWNQSFSGQKAARDLRSALLEESYSSPDRRRIDQHLEMFTQFDRQLASLVQQSLPTRRNRQVSTNSGSFKATEVTLQNDRIIYRDTPGGLGRYLLWKEILPGSRLDLLLEADLEKDWMGYLGLLLEWNNRKEAAERIWQEMDFETLQDLLNDLQSSENPSEESTNP